MTRKASPAPGTPGYRGPKQSRPTPPPAPPLQRVELALTPLTPAEVAAVETLAATAFRSVNDVIENDPANRIVKQIHEERALHQGNVGGRAVREQTPDQALQLIDLQVESARESAIGEFADPRSYRAALIRIAARALDGALACDRFIAANGDAS